MKAIGYRVHSLPQEKADLTRKEFLIFSGQNKQQCCDSIVWYFDSNRQIIV